MISPRVVRLSLALGATLALVSAGYPVSGRAARTLQRMANPLISLDFGEAAGSGDALRVAYLLDHGADVNEPGTGWSPLMLAADSGHLETVRLLLARGAVVNYADQYGWTALHVAAKHRRQGVVRLLLRAGADAKARTSKGSTALAIARRRNFGSVVRLLSSAVTTE